MSTTTFSYTELDNATRLAMIKQRVRDLETVYQQLSLRVNAPAPGEVVTQQDRDNMAQLEASLASLHDLEASLQPPA